MPVWEPLTKSLLYAAIATLVVAPLALGDHGRYPRLLGSRPMVWLGEISYEIFLLHVVVMAVALGVVLDWPLFTGSLAVLYVVTLAITVPLAMLLRRLTNSENTRGRRGPATPAGRARTDCCIRPCARRWSAALSSGVTYTVVGGRTEARSSSDTTWDETVGATSESGSRSWNRIDNVP